MKEESVQNSRSEHAYQQLLAAIRNGSLTAGSRIRETELASRLGISRTPVREAIRRLETEGLIRMTPHKGMAIAQLDYQSVMELYQMREVLEGSAAALAAMHASDPEILALADLVEQEKQLIEAPEQQATKNKAFHQALYRAAHNRYLLKSLRSLQDAMVLLGTTTYLIEGRSQQAVAEHERIVQAITARDSILAEQAAREHIRAAQQARVKLINHAMMDQNQ